MPPGSPLHLKPAAELAPRVLLPGDPHRALAVAQHLLEKPRMFNHHRGLWGYTGLAPDGEPLSVQATGMGGPSAAIVVEELLGLGARTLVRIGTCGALAPDLALGDLVVAAEVVPADGASRALGASGELVPDPDLCRALAAVAGPGRRIVSTDLFYDPRPERAESWRAGGAAAVEMEAAAVLAVAARAGAAAACVLAVTDLLGPGGEHRARLERAAVEAAGLRLGEAGYAALSAGADAPRPDGAAAPAAGPTGGPGLSSTGASAPASAAGDSGGRRPAG